LDLHASLSEKLVLHCTPTAAIRGTLVLEQFSTVMEHSCLLRSLSNLGASATSGRNMIQYCTGEQEARGEAASGFWNLQAKYYQNN
jgi:hypothetical protein